MLTGILHQKGKCFLTPIIPTLSFYEGYQEQSIAYVCFGDGFFPAAIKHVQFVHESVTSPLIFIPIGDSLEEMG